jgi:DNA-binding NarL/FixJ family response regulator
MIRVFLADDHDVVREGVKRLVDAGPDLAVVGEASTGAAVLEQARLEAWDVLVLDLSLPDLNGLEVLKQVKVIRPRLHVLVLTMQGEDQYALRILKAGADGYLTKGRPGSEILDAIRTIAAGGKYLTPRLAELLLSTRADSERAPHEMLTDREHDVLVMVGRGKTPSAIANELGVSPSTVSTHIQRVKTKLGLESLGQLVQYAVRAGLAD